MRKSNVSSLIAVFIGLLAMSMAYSQDVNDEVRPETDDNQLDLVLDLERPSNTDILLLRNGDQLTGTILNEKFSIRTSYAELHFNNRMIAGIDLEGGANNIESIVTVNNNRFSGFIDNPVFVFQLQTGPRIEIRREKVLKAIFRVREAERRGIPQRQFLVLKNGDYFSGKVINRELTVATTYATVPISLDNADTVTMIGEHNPLTRIRMLNNDVLQGVLETEDIKVELDVGTQVNIFQDRIDTIYCQEGFIPEIAARVGSGRALVLDRGQHKLDATWDTQGPMRTATVEPGGKADHAGLKVGDVFVTVDGQPLNGKSHFDQVRKEILEGKRSRAVFGIKRGTQTFTVVLLQK